MALPQSKQSKVRAAMNAGNWQGAIRIAARFHDLGQHRAAILDAHAAYVNPRMQAQLGKDITQSKQAGQDARIDMERQAGALLNKVAA